jgi:hypothetical protein
MSSTPLGSLCSLPQGWSDSSFATNSKQDGGPRYDPMTWHFGTPKGACLFNPLPPPASAQANGLTPNSNMLAAKIGFGFSHGRTRFADGSHAVPVTFKGGPAHEVFLKNYVGEGPEEFRSQWRKVVITGQGALPKAFRFRIALIE